jgi:hypothetical protein
MHTVEAAPARALTSLPKADEPLTARIRRRLTALRENPADGDNVAADISRL